MDEKEDRENSTEAVSREDATVSEIRDRAAVMRRLGHSKADAIHRCMGNIAWAFSVSGQPAVSPARVRKLVGEVYGKVS
ncbi:MAG: hypothetical protein H8D71_00630 [Deltaproteobacteria bacterium]|jgi:hypothetical protein|nr:hypothetical protein [Deltaproteobacteria bacterium]|tara:strand:- start:175 stop:411 length:237 start_codon:yes stop_codon:yes gene_type:complete